jgi:hypothetical protein
MACHITVDPNPMGIQTGGDGVLEQAVMTSVVVVSAPTEACLALLGKVKRGERQQSRQTVRAPCTTVNYGNVTHRYIKDTACAKAARGGRRQGGEDSFDVVPSRRGIVCCEPRGQHRHRGRIVRVMAGRRGVSIERGCAKGWGDVVASQPPAHLFQRAAAAAAPAFGRGEEEEHEDGGCVSRRGGHGDGGRGREGPDGGVHGRGGPGRYASADDRKEEAR